MANPITFGGLATGLDSRAIIDALMGVERIPILRLEGRKTQLGKQDDIYNNLNSRLKDLRSALDAINTAPELASYRATSSNESVANVSASGLAAEGSYTITVGSLAKAESRATAGYADTDTTSVGTGTFSILVGSTAYEIAPPGGEETLASIRDAINASGAPVVASIINDGSATDPYNLVVTSRETGTAAGFTVDLTGFTPNGEGFTLDSNVIQASQDASLQLNGLTVTRGSNTITDLVPGVSLNLASAGVTEVTVSKDMDAVKGKLEKLVTAFNDVMSIISSQNVVDKDGKTSAVLFGDSGVRSIGSQLRSALGTRVSGSGAYTSLAALGVRSDATGKISFDTAKLDAALNSDFDGVMNLFTNASTGLATTFKEKVDSLTHPVNGVIKARRDGIASRRSSIDERITTLESRLGRFEQRLINRYAALETTVSSFQAQGAALNSFF